MQVARLNLPAQLFFVRDISSRPYLHIGEYSRAVFCKGFRPRKAEKPLLLVIPAKAGIYSSAQVLAIRCLTSKRRGMVPGLRRDDDEN